MSMHIHLYTLILFKTTMHPEKNTIRKNIMASRDPQGTRSW